MGAKVEIFNQVIYLSTAAIEWYQRNNIQLTILQDGINDDIINIFEMSRAVTLKEGATYQQLLNYYLLIGMTRDAAVTKAQSQIGISKETLIKTLDVIQADIIADKSLKIQAAEDLIQQQTDTQKTTFEEIDLTQFGDSAPAINTETNATENLRNLPKTTGDISSDALAFDFQPEGNEKTLEVAKEDIHKHVSTTTVVIKDDRKPFDFKSFGTSPTLIIGLGVLAGIIVISLVLRGKK